MRVLLRAAAGRTSRWCAVFDLEIDTLARLVRRGGCEIHLTPREYALLDLLAFHRGQVVTRSLIRHHLYDEDDEVTSNVVDVYIRYLRHKIDKGFRSAVDPDAARRGLHAPKPAEGAERPRPPCHSKQAGPGFQAAERLTAPDHSIAVVRSVLNVRHFFKRKVLVEKR